MISIGGTKVNKKLGYADRETVQDIIEKDPKEFDIRQKMLYNEKADKEQYNNYKSRLGGEAPRNFSEFQEIKYRDNGAYADLKDYYRYRGRVSEATRSDFDIAQRIKDKGIVGTIRVPAAKIDVSELTAYNDHAFRHGCSIADAKHYIQTAKVSITRSRWDGLSQNFYSDDGAVYIDYTTTKIKTMYGKEDFDPETKSMMEEFE